MQITSTNAQVVAQIFAVLADERFSMRTPEAIIKGTAITVESVMNAVAEMGLRIRYRRADGRSLVERPVAAEEARTLAAKAQLLALNNEGSEPFELDFSPVQIDETADLVAGAPEVNDEDDLVG